MVSYAVKEIFLTLQGEGMQAGRPAVFCRFAGCNLWSGREQDRHAAVCRFCDTDFVGTNGTKGGRYRSARSLADAIASEWTGGESHRLCVLTGGEPLLQVDNELVEALHDLSFRIAIETNGTLPVPAGIDWICVSPKSNAALVVTRGHELKLVYPQLEALPDRFEDMDFDNFLLQPMDGPDAVDHTRQAIAYCLAHPKWRLSVQIHKHLGIR
jgi:7-carboxy-7-deazaguanine synthase (Cx14CxxC type)